MIHVPRRGTTVRMLLISAALALAGCAAGQRNLAEAIIVTAPPSLREDEAKIVLELRDRREALSLREADSFLTSDRAGRLSHALRSQLRERCRKLRQTLPQARQEAINGLAMIRPDPGEDFADDNMVIYVVGRSAVHVLFSRAEVAQLLTFKECSDDLATIRYTHPEFDPVRLGELRDRVAALGLELAQVTPSEGELERLKTEAATRVLEGYLRDGGFPLADDLPLLTSGPLSPMRSPKLSAALRDSAVVEQLLQGHDPNRLRALLFLLNRDIIVLDYP